MLVTSSPLFYSSGFTVLAGASWERLGWSLPGTAVHLCWDEAVGCSHHHGRMTRGDP